MAAWLSRFRFSIKTLLVSVLLAGSVMTLRRHWAAWVLEEKGAESALPPGLMPDGTEIRRFSVITREKMVLLWDNDTGTVTTFPHDVSVTAAAISPDEVRLAVACADHRIVVWDTRNVRECTALAIPRDGAAEWLSFSRDGITIVAVVRASDGQQHLLFSRRQHPEEWWGVVCLPEFWTTIVLAGLLVNIFCRRWFRSFGAKGAPLAHTI